MKESEPSTRRLVTAEALRVGYHGQAILPPMDFSMGGCEFWALIGRNGSGKTTLLRTMLGLLPRIDGELRMMPGLRMGYVPQRSTLDTSVPMRVIDLVRSGLDRGWSFLDPLLHRKEHDRVERVLEETQLTALARRQYRTLSEGQKQRALLARVMVGEPQLLVLDEPTSAMDAVAEEAAFGLVERLKETHDLAVIVVSHHLKVIRSRASHILFVDIDDSIVLAGSLDEVSEAEAFQRRYGSEFREASA